MINEKSYFEVFDLPEQFAVDSALLKQRHRELQKAFHPDRFANDDEREQRVALQYSTYINEAYEALNSTLSRAQYLLSRRGFQQNASHTTSSDPAFLMQQIDWREALAEVYNCENPEAALDTLSNEINDSLVALKNAFESAYNNDELEHAQQIIEKMHFLVKLCDEIDLLEGELLDS